jgi:hypothetical protein
LAASLFLFVVAFMVRWNLDVSDGPTRQVFLDLLCAWFASVVLVAVTGSVALIAEGRPIMVLPLLAVGYYFALFAVILMTPYSNVGVVGGPFLYGAFYLFWFVLLKVPLPGLSRRRRRTPDPYVDWT